MNGLKPLVQRNAAFFKDCTNANSEFLAAFGTFLEAATLTYSRFFLENLEQTPFNS